MADRYGVVVLTARIRFGRLSVELREPRSEDLDPEAARLNALCVAAQVDPGAAWRQVFVRNGETLTPVELLPAPDSNEEVPDADLLMGS